MSVLRRELTPSAGEFVPGPGMADSMFPGGLTVLMAVYGKDDPELFASAVESVYRNTVRPDDFVLVVDGPTPLELRAVIERKVAEQGIRIVYLKENVGLARALNQGLALVRTAWVARADADDINVPTRFESQGAALQRMGHQVDLLGSAIVEVDRNGLPIAVRDVPTDHDGIVRRLSKRNPFNHMSVVFRTEKVRELGGYPEIYLKEDYALWASMIARGTRCANVSEVLVRATAGHEMYRRRGGLRYARSEWELQLHLCRLGHRGLASALVYGSARALASVVPASVRGWLYERFLRSPPRPDVVVELGERAGNAAEDGTGSPQAKAVPGRERRSGRDRAASL